MEKVKEMFTGHQEQVRDRSQVLTLEGKMIDTGKAAPDFRVCSCFFYPYKLLINTITGSYTKSVMDEVPI